MLEILACPVPASLQDGGRPGYRHFGVPLAGALDANWLAIANALAGNPPHAAAIEMRLAGPALAAGADAVFAIAGDTDARILGADGERPVAPWRGHRLHAGEQLRVAAVRSGVAYLAFAGGIDGRMHLGSRSAYARAGLGETIAKGMALKVGASGMKCPEGGTAPLRYLPAPPLPASGHVRVLAGPERDSFTTAAWEALLAAEFEVSRDSDRMGLRLAGPRLEHRDAAAADIVSDAVTPGVIQVPADGRPLLLLADCQTVGGYPRIAVVIGADLPRLAHALPGSRLRFAAVDLDAALAARRDSARMLDELLATVTTVSDGPDLDALYGANLIDGVIHAH